MKLSKKFIAVPAIPLAAGLGLAACGTAPIKGAAPAGSSIAAQCAALKSLSTNNSNGDTPITQADIAKANVLANSETPPLRGAMRSLINDAVTMQKHQDAGNTQGLLDDYGRLMVDAGVLKGICPGIDITSGSSPAPSASPTTPATQAPVATPMPKIGQPAKAANYTLTITKIVSGQKALGDPNNYLGEGPSHSKNGQFIVIVVSMHNNSNAPQYVPITAKIVGTDGRTYDHDSDDITALVNAQIQYLGLDNSAPQNINPGITAQDVFIWDVPANVIPSSVTIAGGIDYGTDGSATFNVR